MNESTKLERTNPADPRRRLWKSLGELTARHTSSLLMFMVLCVVLAVGAFMIGDLHTASVQTQKMYAGAVRGLREIGELQYEAQETRRSTLYALTTNDSNLQVEYADQSRGADQLVTDGIKRYLAEARAPREVELGKRLQADWSAYLKVRDEVLASILEGSTKEAVDMDLSGGVPSFERVRQDLEEVKRLYDEQASDQLALVDASSRRSVIRHHSSQLTELVNQILQFAATHEGRNRYTLRPLEVRSVITSVITNTRELAEEAGAVIEEHIAADLPTIMADFSALCQCLQNLVVNALKYGGKNPGIAVWAMSGHGEKGKADEVWISVEDHGIGIDSAELKQIFEPFYRSPAVTAAQIHGTGLGLPLAKGIAEAMGGKISVVSKLGIGSRFTLHLPAAHPIKLESQNQLEQRVSQS